MQHELRMDHGRDRQQHCTARLVVDDAALPGHEVSQSLCTSRLDELQEQHDMPSMSARGQDITSCHLLQPATETAPTSVCKPCYTWTKDCCTQGVMILHSMMCSQILLALG